MTLAEGRQIAGSIQTRPCSSGLDWDKVAKAAETDDVVTVRRAVSKEPRLLHGWASDMQTLMFRAAGRGQEAVVSLLLGAGADPNTPCHAWWACGLETPLLVARRRKRNAVVKLLIQRGAVEDIFTCAALGDSPYHGERRTENGERRIVFIHSQFSVLGSPFFNVLHTAPAGATFSGQGPGKSVAPFMDRLGNPLAIVTGAIGGGIVGGIAAGFTPTEHRGESFAIGLAFGVGGGAVATLGAAATPLIGIGVAKLGLTGAGATAATLGGLSLLGGTSAAAGDVTYQLTALGLGLQDEFSYRQLAIAAALGAALPPAAFGLGRVLSLAPRLRPATIVPRISTDADASFLTRFGRFFFDPRDFRRVISPEYWGARGPAQGRSLHHWLFPQRATMVPQGLRNAGFNLVELPGWPTIRGFNLNSWMGFAHSPVWSWRNRWADKLGAIALENGIRVLIPGSIAAGGYAGYAIGQKVWGQP